MLNQLIMDDADFREFLLKVNEVQTLERSARKMLERTLADMSDADETEVNINWLTLTDAKSGVLLAYKKNDLKKNDIVRAVEDAYLRQSQFMMVLAYEAFEFFVEMVCTRLSIPLKGNFRFPDGFNDLRTRFSALTDLVLPRGHSVQEYVDEKNYKFHYWEFVYIVRDLRQVVVHEHGCCDSSSLDRRLSKLCNHLGEVNAEQWPFLKSIYCEFFKKQHGSYCVWMVNGDGFTGWNLNFIVEILKSYAYFIVQACIVDTDKN